MTEETERPMQGFVLYRGPSMIDGQPIVVVVIGLETGGSNSKTGYMAQTYIMRADQNPMVAVHTGADVSICGDCRHRGRIIRDLKTGASKCIERSCYVTLMHGPRVVWDALCRGLYPDVPIGKARALLARRRVRLGSYGDPAAAPFLVWQEALSRVDSVNGYTHLWTRFPEFNAFCMASVDTDDERAQAKLLGFRTYRVRPRGTPRLKGEGGCPGSDELGKSVQCSQCMLCGGLSTKAKADITIEAHGTGAGHYERALLAA